MTAQATEKLYIFDEEYALQGEPLFGYLKKRKDINFTFRTTDCWRGYIGSWEIKNQKLYLIDFIGFINDEDVRMDYLFENKKEVVASWYTGTLIVPQGNILNYVHAGFGSTYERELIFYIENGILKNQKIKDNRTNEIREFNFIEYFLDNVKNKIQNASIYELIDLFREESQRIMSISQDEFSKLDNSNSNLCAKIDISKWNEEDKDNLFLSALKGINYFTFIISNCKSFPIGDFNSVLKAMNGCNEIYINKKGIKWYPEEIKIKIREQGVVFDDLNRKKDKYNSEEYNEHFYYERETYDEYNGSYAQDYMGLSDQFINDVFEGDPDLYWNID